MFGRYDVTEDRVAPIQICPLNNSGANESFSEAGGISRGIGFRTFGPAGILAAFQSFPEGAGEARPNNLPFPIRAFDGFDRS